MQNMFSNTQFTLLATLYLQVLRLTNDPVLYNPFWPMIPHNIPFDIPKFGGKMGDDLSTHITTYHLWHVSISILYDNVNYVFSLIPLSIFILNGILNFLAPPTLASML